MLEKECIQSRAFRNVIIDGEKVGFQLSIRLTYYRGVWLSQLRPAIVTVDGERFENDQITWTIGGTVYTQDALKNYGDIHWNLLEPAVLTINRPGGLATGLHDIEVEFAYSSSYMPPEMDELLSRLTPNKRRLVLVY